MTFSRGLTYSVSVAGPFGQSSVGGVPLGSESDTTAAPLLVQTILGSKAENLKR